MNEAQIIQSPQCFDQLERIIELDPEWVELIKEAKRYGINIDEIRKFLRGED